MIINKVDDKTSKLELLEELKKSSSSNAHPKDCLAEELHNICHDIRGKKTRTFILTPVIPTIRIHAVLNDFRISIDGETAQIDHVLITRFFVFLVETRNFNGNVTINEHGEFSVKYPNGKQISTPSPLEQSCEHERIFLKLLERLDIRTFSGTPLKVEHIVLFWHKSIIKRPDAKKLDTSNIIKADALRTWHNQFMERQLSIVKTLVWGINAFRSGKTIREWTEKSKRQHRPADLLELPDSMKPQMQAAASI